ncbi:ion transporter [Muriicola sp.]|uniref:ion transporter n=1 Tax=Muriicola sp. TaxID=2020856 RepID=UPI003C74DA9F
MKEKLRLLIDDNSTPQGKMFDYAIQFLIIASLIAFAVETLPNNEPEVTAFLYVFEVFCVAIFTTEYLLRILIAKKPLKYIFSFYGIIDLFAILPFYLTKAFDLRALRAFRIFRIFRALKLIRYNKAMQRIHIAARLMKEEIVLFLIITGIFTYLTSCGIYFFENEAQPMVFSSIFHSLWWAIVTLTTVGYGDVYPITMGGKIFTFFVLIIGVGIVTVPAGLVSSAVSKAREIQEDREDTEVSLEN